MFLPVNMFGKKKDDNSGDRDRQIKEFRTYYPTIRRPNNDDTVFEMLFEVDKKYSTLRIYILPDFPTSKPG